MSQTASQALARKWRPHDFESLVGQAHVVKALSHALDTQRLHHAYLFTGTRGVGKTTIARILAKAVNCEQGMSKSPCGKCSSCTEITQGRFTDLLEVDAATNTRVDEMRQLLENAMYAPTAGRYKVYVIDEVHMLSTSAFNAMLKTLEEPPGHVLFILATTDPQKIPATVLSRCLQFGLRQLTPEQISEHLSAILVKERVEAEASALRLIAKAARGSLRDALSLTDQAIAYSAGIVSEASVRAMLGSVDQQVVIDILQALANSDAVALHVLTKQLVESSAPFGSILSELATASYRLSLASLAGGLDEQDPDDMALASLAGQLSPEMLQLVYQIATHAKSELHLAPEDSVGFGMALLRMVAFKPAAPSFEPASSPQLPVNGHKVQPDAGQPKHVREVTPVKEVVPSKPQGDGPAVSLGPSPPAKPATRSPSDAARMALAAAKAVMQRGAAGASSPKPVGKAVSYVSRVEPAKPTVVEKDSLLETDDLPPWVSENIEQTSFEAQEPIVELDAKGANPTEDLPTLSAGDWATLSEKLPATGLTRQALVQTEFIGLSAQANGLLISLRTPLRRYAEPSVAERMEELLAGHFGRRVQVNFEVGEVGQTAHLQHSELRKQAFEQARQSIESDPFIRALRDEFGADILDGSQRPLHSQGPADV